LTLEPIETIFRYFIFSWLQKVCMGGVGWVGMGWGLVVVVVGLISSLYHLIPMILLGK
jgi:hypothetical protein